MITPTFLEIATIILIVLGAGIMFFADLNIRQILKVKQEQKETRRWRILFSLAAFFLIGYLATVILVLVGLSRYLVIAAGIIFFFGALFVFLVSQVSSSTIQGYLSTVDKLHAEQAEVGNRSLDLERRISQLHAVAEISRSITGVLASQKLLQEAVDLILKRFNLYYVGIFIVDENRRFAILQAGTGEAGKAMVSEQHKLPVAESSMIGWTILHRQARIALDVGTDAIRFANPHLPDTHSELALPLISGDQVIGALTIQSNQPEAFDEDDITILQNIADTLAIALENAHLFQEAQGALEELRASQRSYVTKTWSETAQDHQGYEYISGTIPPVDGKISSIDVPLTLREQIIGQLHLEGDQDWTPEEQSLIEAVASQAALAMENARLLEDSQQAALRERLVAEITGKVWSSPNTEFILQTAVKELARALRTDDAIIELNPD